MELNVLMDNVGLFHRPASQERFRNIITRDSEFSLAYIWVAGRRCMLRHLLK
jgi:hypothetical protein